MARTDAEEIKRRMKKAAVSALRLCDEMPRTPSGRVISDQLSRCATSVSANYRASRRARSTAEFVAKLGIVEEEADEALFFLELAAEMKHASAESLRPLYREYTEFLRMVVATIRTTSRNASGSPAKVAGKRTRSPLTEADPVSPHPTSDVRHPTSRKAGER